MEVLFLFALLPYLTSANYIPGPSILSAPPRPFSSSEWPRGWKGLESVNINQVAINSPAQLSDNANSYNLGGLQNYYNGVLENQNRLGNAYPPTQIGYTGFELTPKNIDYFNGFHGARNVERLEAQDQYFPESTPFIQESQANFPFTPNFSSPPKVSNVGASSGIDNSHINIGLFGGSLAKGITETPELHNQVNGFSSSHKGYSLGPKISQSGQTQSTDMLTPSSHLRAFNQGERRLNPFNKENLYQSSQFQHNNDFGFDPFLPHHLSGQQQSSDLYDYKDSQIDHYPSKTPIPLFSFNLPSQNNSSSSSSPLNINQQLLTTPQNFPLESQLVNTNGNLYANRPLYSLSPNEPITQQQSNTFPNPQHVSVLTEAPIEDSSTSGNFFLNPPLSNPPPTQKQLNPATGSLPLNIFMKPKITQATEKLSLSPPFLPLSSTRPSSHQQFQANTASPHFNTLKGAQGQNIFKSTGIPVIGPPPSSVLLNQQDIPLVGSNPTNTPAKPNLDPKASVQKSVFIFEAPEMPAPPPIKIPVTGSIDRRHYNIVFIKLPSKPAPEILLPQDKPTNSEKTLIYLLSELPRAPIAPVLNLNTPIVPSKPEVFFIKYSKGKEDQSQSVSRQKAVNSDNVPSGVTQSYSMYPSSHYARGSTDKRVLSASQTDRLIVKRHEQEPQLTGLLDEDPNMESGTSDGMRGHT